MAAAIGTKVPEFSLPDHERNPVTQEDLLGRKALVVFIPFPFSGICEGELCMLRDSLSELNDLDAHVVAITCDTVFSNGKWSELNGFGFPVLSDYWPHGKTSMAFGVFNEAVGVATRTTFVLDEEGIVRDIIASESLGLAREHDAYVAALEAI